MASNFLKRIHRLEKMLRSQNVSSALLISSAPRRPFSRDQFYRYRQDSDFYYLTGSTAEDLTLLLSTEQKKPILFAPKVDQSKVLWEGTPPSFRVLASGINAKLESAPHQESVIKKKLHGIEQLFYQNVEGTLAWTVAQDLISLPSHRRGNSPSRFTHSDTLLEPLRLIKDSQEIALIREAGKRTAAALKETLPMIRNGIKESDIAAHIRYCFEIQDCVEAFHTIAAGGRSAATLHYHAHNRKLKGHELLLLDFGASYQMYGTDITRTLPVDGRFTDDMRELYEIVLEAKEAAAAKVKDGVRIKTVYDAAARILTQGLKDLGVLRGSVSALMKKAAYRTYFPHGIGHSLGLDTHDIGKLRGNNNPILRKGMVFTVEPGLYFPKPIRHLPACGVRIEDSLLVTAKGHRNLTPDFPVEPGSIEEIMAG